MHLNLNLLVRLLVSLPHILLGQQLEIEYNFNSGEWDKNIIYINALLAQANAAHNYIDVTELTVLKARQFVAKTSHQNFPPDSAQSLLEKAKLLSEKYSLQRVQSDVLQQTGQLVYREAFENGNFLKARFYFSNALTLRKQLNDPRRISQSLFYIGLTYEQLSIPDSAKLFYAEAYQLALQHHLKIEQSDAARHLGSVSETTNHLKDARKYYEESLLKRQEAKYAIGVPYAQIALADFISKEHPRIADSLYKQAIYVAERNNVWRAQVNALNSLGESNNNDCMKTIPLFTKAHQLAATINYKAGEKRAEDGLIKCKK